MFQISSSLLQGISDDSVTTMSNWEINTKNRQAIVFDETQEKEWKGPFFFVQGADTQYGLISRYINHDTTIVWEKEKELSKALVEKINNMDPPPRFFVICGDLVDASQEETIREPQERDFKAIMGKVRPDVPVLCVCGNHDIGNTPTPESIQRYRNSFGDDFYSFMVGGILFVVINSQYFFDPSGVPEMASQHSEWLSSLLDSAQANNIKRAVVFQHIPWFLKTPDEAKDPYFNLEQSLRDLWLPKFQESGVEAVFCGHYHRNAGGDFKGMPVVVTSAVGAQLGGDKSGARIVTVLPDKIKHEYYAIEDIPMKNL